MDDDANKQGECELIIDEIIDEAMTYLDIEAEALSPEEPDGFCCDMTSEEHELARATIAYMGYRLLMMDRIKHGDVIGNSGGWVGVRHYESETWKEIASALGIRGSEANRIDEAKRLYKVASKREDGNEGYRKKVWSVMEGFMEDYDLDANSLGIVFV
ncbi:MAG: hypothetical protein IJ087_07445 [Eggerthellaceae bacterium]|nr:hypothetical protein [Eggerthellaceae bacterium]